MCIWTLTTRQSNVYIPVDPRNTLAGCWLALPNEAVIVASTSSQTTLMAGPIMNQPEKITLNKAPISTSVAVTKLKFNFLKKSGDTVHQFSQLAISSAMSKYRQTGCHISNIYYIYYHLLRLAKRLIWYESHRSKL